MSLNTQAQAFFDLEPHKVLSFVDQYGFKTTGEIIQLNSYENRVFEIGIEPSSEFLEKKIIAKFYRPNRWSKSAILEEHEFLLDLQKEGIPAIAPLTNKENQTLQNVDSNYLALFPKVLGRMPQEFINDELYQIGRRLAQIHNIGSKKKFKYRPTTGSHYYGGWQNLDLLYNHISAELLNRYQAAAEEILFAVESQIDPENNSFKRIHGDCHKGNLLSDGKQFFYVDFDDSCNGPQVQDFWMLLSDELVNDEERDQILEGYEELRSFDWKQWNWIPMLRGLRIIGYAAWIAARWEDPSFPRLFPEFGTYKYWAEETEALERIAWKL